MRFNYAVLAGGWYKPFPFLRKAAFSAVSEIEITSPLDVVEQLLALIDLTKECNLPLEDNLTQWDSQWIKFKSENLEVLHRYILNLVRFAKGLTEEERKPVEMTVELNRFNGLTAQWLINLNSIQLPLANYLEGMQEDLHNLKELAKELKEERPDLYQYLVGKVYIVEDDMIKLVSLYLKLIEDNLNKK